jgi:uncharacterized tellurite resistance protein B-like protein
MHSVTQQKLTSQKHASKVVSIAKPVRAEARESSNARATAGNMDDTHILAVTVVLVGMAGADGRYSYAEITLVYDLLQERFGISPRDVYRYIERVTSLYQVFGHRRLLNMALRYLATERENLKQDFFTMLTEVANADGKLVQREVRWLKRFVRRVALSREECHDALLGKSEN